MTACTPLACRAALALMLPALVGGSASACGGVHRSQSAPDASAPLVLQIGTSLPRKGIPAGGVPAVLNSLIAEPLVSADRNGRVQARVAERWEWLDNGLTLKLTLPSGVLFHDGVVLDAATAVGLLKAEFTRRPVFSYASIERMEVPDNQTILIRLSRREGFLPADLTAIALRRDAVGTGAFMLEGGTSPEEAFNPQAAAVRLRAFNGYRQGRPQVSQVDVRAYPTLRSAWTGMMRGEINMLYEVSRDAAEFVEQQSSSVRTYSFLRPYVLYMTFNMRHPVLGRREVRQALSEAVDRAAIVKEGMRGRGEPADGPVWKYHWAYSPAQRTYQHNPAAAKLRLDAAGLAPHGSSPDRMPSRLHFTCLLWGEDPRFERIALVLQKQLYDIGVDMEIDAVSTKEMIERMQTGRFDALLFEQVSGFSLNWMYRNWRSHPNVEVSGLATGYTAADDALDRLRGAIDEAEVRDAVGAVQRIFYEDPPALFLAWPQASRAVNVDIDVAYQPNADIVGRIWKFRRGASEDAAR